MKLVCVFLQKDGKEDNAKEDDPWAELTYTVDSETGKDSFKCFS